MMTKAEKIYKHFLVPYIERNKERSYNKRMIVSTVNKNERMLENVDNFLRVQSRMGSYSHAKVNDDITSIDEYGTALWAMNLAIDVGIDTDERAEIEKFENALTKFANKS